MNPNDVTPTTEATTNEREPTSRGRCEGQAARSAQDAEQQAGRLFNSEAEGRGRDARPAVPLSANKLAANRRNAGKSTGPRTLAGKLSSRMNAVRHGILSSAVVVRGLRIQEQEDEFRAVREQYWECLTPVGRVEEMLADKIVTAWWRSRRALIAETGEIVKSVDGGLRRREDGVMRVYAVLMDPIRDASLALEGSTEGLDFLSAVLERVREGMAKDGQLTYELCELTEKRFPGGANALTRRLWEYHWKFRDDTKAVKNEEKAKASAAAQSAMADSSASEVTTAVTSGGATDKPVDTLADGPPKEEELSREVVKERHQLAVERYIELKLIDYAELRRKCLEQEDKKETVHQAADVLPSAEVLEKIMRYEGSLDRQLYRAMNQLERLQRRRGGERVAAPLMMDVMK